MSTELFKAFKAWADENDDPVVREAWEGTPWMVNAFTGSSFDRRVMDIRHWCHENFGDEALPHIDRPGNWREGNATIHGWTYMGFKTEEMMDEFLEAWPPPAAAESA